MAIIIGSEIKKAELQNIELDYNMEIDLINKTLKKMENFPTVVMEDNNSISIVMKAPLEYNGVDLMGTNCIVKYNTSWVDENGKNSAGQVDLTNTCIEKQDCLLYTWVLDINQTLKTGVCNFNVIFLMNLEEDPYINNTNVFITDEIEGELSYDSNNVIETNLKYWTISTKPEAINIQNSFFNIESDYNLILPENFAEELQKTNEKVENIEIDVSSAYEKIENNEKEIQVNKLNIEKCATKDQLITETTTIADIATEAYNKSEQAIDAINNLPKQQDYIIGFGETTVEGVTWTWEKWNSGTVKMWCKAITSNVNEYIARSEISYPTGITLVEEGCAFVTIRSGFQNLGFGLDINAKAVAGSTKATIYAHKLSGGLTEDNSNIPVSLFIIGKWK